MTKIPFIAISLFLLVSFTSCFQLIEEITLKNDGSGEMQITLNLSQSKSKLASIMLLDSLNGHKIPKDRDIEKFMEETVAFLRKSEGISNVQKTVDLKNYIATVSFGFSDLAKINGLTRKLLDKHKLDGPENLYTFDKAGNTFKKIYRYSPKIKDAFNKLNTKDRDIFRSASYTSIFRFQRNIASSSNKQSKISPSGKALMLNAAAMEIIYGTANISTNIQLTP